jgi:hypothetical protein
MTEIYVYRLEITNYYNAAGAYDCMWQKVWYEKRRNVQLYVILYNLDNRLIKCTIFRLPLARIYVMRENRVRFPWKIAILKIVWCFCAEKIGQSATHIDLFWLMC